MNPSAPPQVPQWSTRQVVTATLLVVSILVLFALIYRFNNVIFLFFIAIVLSTAIRPAVKWLSRHGLPRRAGVILIYIVGFALLAGLLVAVVPLLVDQLTEISAELPTNYANFRSDLSISRSRILRELAHQLPRELSLTPTLTESDPGEIDLPADGRGYPIPADF
jgi:predicted PurR-regulated permease PerM